MSFYMHFIHEMCVADVFNVKTCLLHHKYNISNKDGHKEYKHVYKLLRVVRIKVTKSTISRSILKLLR